MPPAARKLLRLLGLLVYVGVAGVLFVVTAYAAFNLFVRSGTAPVPDITGQPAEGAREQLSDSGFEISMEEGGRFDAEVPAGAVLSQDPGPRTLVKRGSAVEVVLSLGPQRLTVPDLVGRSLPSAQVALAAAGLTAGPTLQVFSSRPAGTVVDQDPRAGASVPNDGNVELMLSGAGDAGGKRFLMPDLIYHDYQEVRRFFERAGLRLGRVTFELYDGAGDGTILRQFPLAGHPLTAQEAVSLVVAAYSDPFASSLSDFSDPGDDATSDPGDTTGAAALGGTGGPNAAGASASSGEFPGGTARWRR